MNRFLKKLTTTLIVFTVVVPVGIIIWYLSPLPNGNIKFNKGGYGHLYSRLSELDTIKDIDVLFLGSSHTYRGFDSQKISNELGLNCFNLGSSGQTPDVTKVLLKTYLNEIKPKLVVYEVVPDGIFNESIGSRVDIVSNLPFTRLKSLRYLEGFGITEFKTLILRICHDLFYQEYYEPLRRGEDEYIPGGYVMRKGFGSTSKYYEEESFIVDTNSKGFKRFLANISYIKSQDIPVILVFAPTTSYDYSRYPSNIDSIYTDMGVYWNFNLKTNLNDSLHFFDSSHLNYLGVHIFNQDLIRSIRPIIDTLTSITLEQTED